MLCHHRLLTLIFFPTLADSFKPHIQKNVHRFLLNWASRTMLRHHFMCHHCLLTLIFFQCRFFLRMWLIVLFVFLSPTKHLFQSVPIIWWVILMQFFCFCILFYLFAHFCFCLFDCCFLLFAISSLPDAACSPLFPLLFCPTHQRFIVVYHYFISIFLSLLFGIAVFFHCGVEGSLLLLFWLIALYFLSGGVQKVSEKLSGFSRTIYYIFLLFWKPNYYRLKKY